MRQGKNWVTFRTLQESNCEVLDKGIISDDEWSSEDSLQRVQEDSWKHRYKYEAALLSNVIKDHNIKTILELGPGPGVLCNEIVKSNVDLNLEYHLVDVEAARAANEQLGLEGIFHVQDLTNDLSIEDLPINIDMFIACDFLEHIQSPANIVLKAKATLKQDGLAFISVPNWRMGHAWIYRGLFDWDNFIHFMWQHGFMFIGAAPSPLKCPKSPKLTSESTMPEDQIDSWNHYMLFKRNDSK